MKKRMISFALALSLLIPLLSPLTVLAKDESASPTTPETQTLPMAEETTAPAAPVEPDAVSEAELLADCAILKYVDAETFRAAGHVARLPELETMSSYAFRNADGTHTVYYLDHPVKYVDDDGELQIIDLTL